MKQADPWDLRLIVGVAQVAVIAVMLASGAASFFAWWVSAEGWTRTIYVVFAVVCTFWAGFGFRLAGRAAKRGAVVACIVLVALTVPAMVFDTASNRRAMSLIAWNTSADHRSATRDREWLQSEVDRLERQLEGIDYPGDSRTLTEAMNELPEDYSSVRAERLDIIAVAVRYERLEAELGDAREALRLAINAASDHSPDQTVDGSFATGLVIFIAVFIAAANWSLAAGRPPDEAEIITAHLEPEPQQSTPDRLPAKRHALPLPSPSRVRSR